MKRIILALGLFIAAISASAADNQYPQLSNVPTVYIETENKVAIPAKTEDYVRATLRIVDGENITLYDALGVRGRGNSTWNLPKKPYRIKFDKKQKLLGDDYANAKSWTLLANHGDKTLMRNAVAACIGKFAGQPFTAAAKFVDLVVNGKYLGSYQISDQIEVRSKRVDIVEQEDEATAESNITGGYLLEVDGFAYQETSYFTTTRGVAITIKSPDEDIINADQKNYIKKYITQFETALFAGNFTDPEKGYRRFVDEETLASWYVSSELTANADAFWSTYIYKDQDDPKIYWGPLWDYDIAFDNCVRLGKIVNNLLSEKGFGDDLTKKWVVRMWQDPWFANLVNDKWRELVDNGIEEHLLNHIDSLAGVLDQSQALNFKIWKINERAYDEIELFNTYSEGVDYLKNFITARTAYLTSAFAQAVNKISIPETFESSSEYYYTIANRGCGLLADTNNQSNVCIWQSVTGRETQHWAIIPDGEGYFTIVNRENNRAISDAAVQSGNSYTRGSQLVMADVNNNDNRQKWSITPAANEKGMGYVITNRQTGLAWNNNNGNTNNGNSIISWTTDENNPSKMTRQWYINKIERKTSGLDNVEIDENAPKHYYDLMGREVTNPGTGIYIVRQGSRTYKVAIK